MENVLLAWEIGDGHGHVRNLIAVADLLKASGFNPVFSIPTLQITAQRLVRSMGYQVHSLAVPPHVNANEYVHPLQNYRAASFVDVLGFYALDRPSRLKMILNGYFSAVKIHSIDLIVFETAPIAAMVANLLDIPCVGVGTSFGIPEVRDGFAKYIQLDSSPLTHIFEEGRLLDIVNSTTGAKFKSLASCFSSNRIHPFCYPALDHYGQQRSVMSRGVGPIWKMSPRKPSNEMHGFAYINSNYPTCNELVSSIRTSGIPFTVFVRNGKYQSAGNMTVVDSFTADDELSKASVVLHHGSAGIGQAALSAGIPQVCFPYHIENTNNAYRLQSLGVSRAIGHQQSNSFVEFLLDGPDLTSHAQAVSQQIDQHKNEFQGAAIAAQSVQHLLN